MHVKIRDLDDSENPDPEKDYLAIAQDSPKATRKIKLKDVSGPTTASVTVMEKDGSPRVTDVDTIIVSNSTLTDNGNGAVTISTGATTSTTPGTNELIPIYRQWEVYDAGSIRIRCDEDEILVQVGTHYAQHSLWLVYARGGVGRSHRQFQGINGITKRIAYGNNSAQLSETEISVGRENDAYGINARYEGGYLYLTQSNGDHTNAQFSIGGDDPDNNHMEAKYLIIKDALTTGRTIHKTGLYESPWTNFQQLVASNQNNHVDIDFLHGLECAHPIVQIYIKHPDGQVKMLPSTWDEQNHGTDQGWAWHSRDSNSGHVRWFDEQYLENDAGNDPGEVTGQTISYLIAKGYQFKVVAGGGIGGANTSGSAESVLLDAPTVLYFDALDTTVSRTNMKRDHPYIPGIDDMLMPKVLKTTQSGTIKAGVTPGIPADAKEVTITGIINDNKMGYAGFKYKWPLHTYWKWIIEYEADRGWYGAENTVTVPLDENGELEWSHAGDRTDHFHLLEIIGYKK
ncbi:hypothetical protein CMK18_21145 [Candidatus Poribacteria bacterium]|nr:hypothetical protein [Candidatus Poribacteria bacterium]